MRCKLDRDLVKRESTLLPRNLPSRLLSRISQVSRIVSQRLRCPLLVPCSPQQRSNSNWSLAYSPIRIVTILWRYCDVPSARFFVDLLLLLFLFNLDIERRWNARRCFNNVFFFFFFFFSWKFIKRAREEQVYGMWRKSDVLTLALLERRRRGENLVKSFLMRDADRAQVCNEKVMEPLCAPCLAQGGAQLSGLSNFQCNWYTEKISRVFKRGAASSVCNLYIYVCIFPCDRFIIVHFRIKFSKV